MFAAVAVDCRHLSLFGRRLPPPVRMICGDGDSAGQAAAGEVAGCAGGVALSSRAEVVRATLLTVLDESPFVHEPSQQASGRSPVETGELPNLRVGEGSVRNSVQHDLLLGAAGAEAA